MSKRPHIPALDGIRGLAILMVFILHYGGGAQSNFFLVRIIGSVIKLGWTGVPLFFVLSGFLITGILWDSFDKSSWWKTFYIRRALRIFPLYYLSLILVVISAFFFGDVRQSLHNVWIYVLYCQNFGFAEGRIDKLGGTAFLTAFWSLAVEEQFYLCWPFLLRRARTIKQAKNLCIAVFVFAFLYRIYGSQYEDIQTVTGATLARAGELAAGAWLALTLRDTSVELARFKRWVPSAAALSLAGFIALSIYNNSEANLSHHYVFIFGLPLLSIFFGCLIFMAIEANSLTQRVFSIRFLRWLGAISYSLYVWHVLLYVPINGLTSMLAPHASRSVQLGLRFLVASVMSITAAQLSYRHFETPFLRLKDRFPGSRPVVPISAAEAIT